MRPVLAAYLLLAPALAALAAVAGACTRNDAKGTGGTGGTGDASAGAPEGAAANGPAAHPIARPGSAVAELGVLTDRPRAELEALITPASQAQLLDARHCGSPPACDAVRAMISDHERVEVTLTSAADWGIPSAATLEVIAKGLTAQQRAAVGKLPTVVVVHVSGKATPQHLVARAGFGLTAAIAERVKGFVYDETVRRIETPDEFDRHVVTAPLGDAVFSEDRILIQHYLQDDGTSRMISLGMRRFGAPDLEVRGAQPGAGRSLVRVMNAVAARLVIGTAEAPFTVTLDDPRAQGGAKTKSATIDLVVPPLQQGDPDNTIVRIVPDGGASVAGYDQLVVALFGAAEQLVDGPDDAELTAARDRARKAFPATAARWKKWAEPRPKLMVKLPFAIAGDAGSEWMWVEVKSVDDRTVQGTLANSPAYATDLRAGAVVKGRTADLYDWMMMLPDGGTEGGETSRILEKRN